AHRDVGLVAGIEQETRHRLAQVPVPAGDEGAGNGVFRFHGGETTSGRGRDARPLDARAPGCDLSHRWPAPGHFPTPRLTLPGGPNMQVLVRGGAAERVDADALVVGVFEGTSRLAGAAQAVDRTTGGALRELLKTKDFTGKNGQIVVLYPTRGRLKRVIV